MFMQGKICAISSPTLLALVLLLITGLLLSGCTSQASTVHGYRGGADDSSDGYNHDTNSRDTNSRDANSNTSKVNDVVVLVHGLGRSDFAMATFAEQLTQANYQVCALDYDSVGETIASVMNTTLAQINACVNSSAKVHFVGHSLGGLVIRAYLQHNTTLATAGRLGQVVLIGTPNQGSEVADYYQDSWLMTFAGEISQAMVTGQRSLGNMLAPTTYNAGIIAGTKSYFFTDSLFNGPNDGLVSVESSKLTNMADFISVDVSHSRMRYSDVVTQQTLYFLANGAFNKVSEDNQHIAKQAIAP